MSSTKELREKLRDLGIRSANQAADALEAAEARIARLREALEGASGSLEACAGIMQHLDYPATARTTREVIAEIRAALESQP